MKPYYEHGGIAIYYGDCRDVLPLVEVVDLIVTDPPYPDWLTREYHYAEDLVECLDARACRQLVFWSAKATFPLSFTAIHIWDKKTGCGSEYERIYERHGHKNWRVFRQYVLNSPVAASYQGDVFWGHPSQKPLRLITQLLAHGGGRTVCDPFMGTGTTLVAAKAAGRCAIGIEIEEKYCEVAAKRLQQEALPLEVA